VEALNRRTTRGNDQRLTNIYKHGGMLCNQEEEEKEKRRKRKSKSERMQLRTCAQVCTHREHA
jgi:hypothetical protein